MKRTLVIAAAVTTLGMAAFLASQLGAQTPGAQPAPAATKIGIVNMAVVLKGYNKFAVYNNEIEKIRLQYDKQEKDLDKLLKDWQDYMTKAKDQVDRDKAEDAIKTIVRKREDNKNEYAKVRNKKSDEQMVQMYREIESAVKAYAGPNAFHLILHYSEPLSEADIYSAPNIQRKLVGPGGSGGVCPTYFVPNMDISADVVRQLNAMYPAPAAAALAPSTGTPGKN